MSQISSGLRRSLSAAALLTCVLSLSACDFINNFNKPKMTPEQERAEGIALGAGCRHSGQTLEDCYQRNPDSTKAGIFAGWKEMHEYMASKNIQTVFAVVPPPKMEEGDKPADKDAAAKDDKSKDDKSKNDRSSKDSKDDKPKTGGYVRDSASVSKDKEDKPKTGGYVRDSAAFSKSDKSGSEDRSRAREASNEKAVDDSQSKKSDRLSRTAKNSDVADADKKP
ncbi:hypothetical protein RGU70_07540 [Herbaspirillum sp. RTI4]|uniref:hypothetical protein n=1 Tax=Herbaspirillum sp. RTI4 TaxID=3048640 RepID=UPI002AB50343|nr:hypothetical protein [Herbaspirillum sp. RTI4]MDY7578171.1 hypothetical protein [Herbaspirillum sp. RTI4]MEA9980760.1 hypothetical protein [Herbaspirillum sp. RTI4]